MFSFEQLQTDPVSRRKFMTAMSAAGLGLAAARLFSPSAARAQVVSPATTQPSFSSSSFPGIPGNDINEVVLNFALTLEILEADLYRQALNLASGNANTAPLAASPNDYTQTVSSGSLETQEASDGFKFLSQFAFAEAAHRDFLSAAISAAGGTPVTGNAHGYAFPTTLTAALDAILEAVLPLEETGVRAYLGAAPFLTSLAYATTATGIYSTEARHSAAIAYVLGRDPGPVMQSGDLTVVTDPPAGNMFEYYLAPSTVITAVQAYYKS
jgi:hypothetical protein